MERVFLKAVFHASVRHSIALLDDPPVILVSLISFTAR